MHNLSIAAIFRHESSWLEEWINYHQSFGVEHFYLFNDDDDTHVSDRILRPYVEKGFVENIHVDELSGLAPLIEDDWINKIYSMMFEMASNETKWLAMLDLDELGARNI